MESLNQFLSTYLIEAIAFIVVVFILLLYVIIKQQSDKPKDLIVHEQTKEPKRKPIHIFSDKKKETQKPHEEPKVAEEESFVEEVQPEVQKPADNKGHLPFKIIKKKRELPLNHPPITKESFAVFTGLKLLVAEDNIINQKVINGILGDSGMQIVMANDGQEALDILEKDKDFSIVLMDAHMPRIDGFEATKRIKADKSLEHILVVALSGDTAADDIKKMYNVGMQEHLEKPLKMDKLYEVIYSYIDMGGEDETPEQPVSIITTDHAILNTVEGMEVCGGDEELYKEILNEFLSMYLDADKKLKNLIAKDQLDEAKSLLLDISGISANIGADTLAEVSTKFREDLIQNETGKLFEDEEKFTDTFAKVVNEIKKFMH